MRRTLVLVNRAQRSSWRWQGAEIKGWCRPGSGMSYPRQFHRLAAATQEGKRRTSVPSALSSSSSLALSSSPLLNLGSGKARHGGWSSSHTLAREIPGMGDADQVQAVVPPPLGNLCIVFTDVVRSTELWEMDTAAMKDATSMHDAIFKQTVRFFCGYEVKYNGDGFMVAFPTASSALSWCLAMQKVLVDIEWPAGILETSLGKEIKDEDGLVIFRGLSVRMTAHWGSPICRLDEATKRMDYLGPMVNRAARCMAVTEGGQIVVSREFLDELDSELAGGKTGENNAAGEADQGSSKSRDNAQKLSLAESVVKSSQLISPEVSNCPTKQEFDTNEIGEHELKGLSEPMHLYSITPSSLRGRLKHYDPPDTEAPPSTGATLVNRWLNIKVM